MHECFAYMSVNASLESSEGIVSSEIGIMDGYEPLSGWDWNLGPLQEHQVLFTTDLSLRPCDVGF